MKKLLCKLKLNEWDPLSNFFKWSEIAFFSPSFALLPG